MSKRSLSLVAIALIASVLCMAVAHACSDLSSMQAILQTPCEHSSSQDRPGGKTENDNCDAIRYGMLSTQASSAQPELLALHSILLDRAILASVSLLDSTPRFWRSHGPPFGGLGAAPRLSHVVLRI